MKQNEYGFIAQSGFSSSHLQPDRTHILFLKKVRTPLSPLFPVACCLLPTSSLSIIHYRVRLISYDSTTEPHTPGASTGGTRQPVATTGRHMRDCRETRPTQWLGNPRNALPPQDRAGSPLSRTQPRPPGNQFPGLQFKSTKVDSKAYAVVFRRLLL
ncbi:hypothetical protein [Brasilonema bromeliae]|uniref:Uncharacterized protein n=1 Tax=Brasilonema bromeliae SPC951 TaxID=385972 RepID=A0ABX1PDC9_9CYAN|nr:hypothetical protein [Brasilonema bromeliae]NMG22498.1 hypothetical protein [Brasilonema bromeliae SPC951]